MEVILRLQKIKKERKKEKKKSKIERLSFLLSTNELLSSLFRSVLFLIRTLLE
jgi:hypothetical protein